MTAVQQSRSERRRPRWLLRQSEFERFVGVVAGLGLLLPWFIAHAEPFSWGLLAAFAAIFLVVGLSVSGPRRRGVAVRGDRIELHGFFGHVSVPVAEVVRLHAAPSMAGVAVETSESMYEWGHNSRITDREIEEMRVSTVRVGEDLGVPFVMHDNMDEYVRVTAAGRHSTWTLRGFPAVLAWPEVWMTMVLGIGASIIRWM